MKLVPMDAQEVRKDLAAKRCNNQKLIEEFVNSEHECVEVVGYSQKNSKICADCLRVAMKSMKIYHIRATVKGDHVFLIKEIRDIYK